MASFFCLLYIKYRTEKVNEYEVKASLYFPAYLEKRPVKFSLMDSSRNIFDSNNLSKGVYFLHFWATWCKSCEEELLSISTIKEKEFNFFCISVDEELEVAINYLKDRNINCPFLFDRGGEVAKKLGSIKFPETYIVKNGNIILKFEGPRDWRDSGLLDFIRDYSKRF